MFDEVPCRISIAVLPASVFGARDLGSPSGIAKVTAEVELGHCNGNNRHSVDASRLEQWSTALVGIAAVDFELGADLAGLVSGRDVMELSHRSATSMNCSADFSEFAPFRKAYGE